MIFAFKVFWPQGCQIIIDDLGRYDSSIDLARRAREREKIEATDKVCVVSWCWKKVSLLSTQPTFEYSVSKKNLNQTHEYPTRQISVIRLYKSTFFKKKIAPGLAYTNKEDTSHKAHKANLSSWVYICCDRLERVIN